MSAYSPDTETGAALRRLGVEARTWTFAPGLVFAELTGERGDDVLADSIGASERTAVRNAIGELIDRRRSEAGWPRRSRSW